MLSVWSPFTDLFRNDEFWNMERFTPGRRFAPPVDVVETDKGFELTAEVPGMKPEDIDVSIEDNVLTLKGERRYEDKVEREGYRRLERHYGSFQRSFTLPEGARTEAIEASVENGLLTLFIPKPEVTTPKKIKVSAGKLTDKAKKIFEKKEEQPQPHAS